MRNNLELHFPSDGVVVEVRDFEVVEKMSRPFEIRLTARAREPLDLARLAGEIARFTARGGPTTSFLGQSLVGDGPIADWTGCIADIEEVGTEKPLRYLYAIHLVHPLWVLGRGKNYRVFQHLSELDIARALIAEWTIEENVLADPTAYKKRDFRVQYGESDLDFVHRNLENIGVSYFLEDSDAGEVVTFSAHPEKSAPRADGLRFFEEPPQETRTEWAARVTLRRSVRAGTYTLQDVDYRLPPQRQPRISRSFAASGERDGSAMDTVSELEAMLETYEYDPGAFAVESAADGDTPVNDRKQATRADLLYGAWLTETRLRAIHASRYRACFETNAFDLHPGAVVRIEDHPRPELADPVLVIETHFTGTEAGAWKMRCVAHPTALPYVPEVVTVRPHSFGVESATVVGTSGKPIDGQEIGSVLVQFHWDREGARDDRSSCWVPVSYGLAGPGRGVFAMPRVGEEVLVSFLGGDLDKPVVTGRMYTHLNKPWTTEVAEMGDLSIKNDSLDTCEQHTGIHLTAHHHPLMHLFTTHDKQLTVGNDENDSVEQNRTSSIGSCCVTKIGGNRSTVVKKNQSNKVGGRSREVVKRRKKIAAKRALSVVCKDHIAVHCDGVLNLGTSGHLTVKSEAIVTIGARDDVDILGDEIDLVVGEETAVVIRKGFVIVQSPKVVINPGPSAIQAALNGIAPQSAEELAALEKQQQQQLAERQRQEPGPYDPIDPKLAGSRNVPTPNRSQPIVPLEKSPDESFSMIDPKQGGSRNIPTPSLLKPVPLEKNPDQLFQLIDPKQTGGRNQGFSFGDTFEQTYRRTSPK